MCEIDSEEKTWRERLQACPAEERGLAVSTLLSVFESDQNRIRGVESKARGVLQSASLVFAGDAVALNLALREEASRATLAIWLVAVSAVYLGTALGAALYVDKPGPRHVLSLEDVLPPDRAGSRLVGAIKRLIDAPMVVKSVRGRVGGLGARSGIGWRVGGCGLGRVRVLRCGWGGFRAVGRPG